MHAKVTKRNAQTDRSTAIERTQAKVVPVASPQQLPMWTQNRYPLQTSPKGNASGDKYEQEADRVADQVTRATDSAVPRFAASPMMRRNVLGGLGDPQGPSANGKWYGQHHPTPPVAVGHSQRLPDPLRSTFERRFGYGFGQVRVHADERSAEAAESIGAQAFTVGSDVFFDQGQYQPGTRTGQKLSTRTEVLNHFLGNVP